nr:MAG TPA: FeoB-associated Cys-rich membrane protein [Bacteriophage sp.]
MLKKVYMLYMIRLVGGIILWIVGLYIIRTMIKKRR